MLALGMLAKQIVEGDKGLVIFLSFQQAVPQDCKCLVALFELAVLNHLLQLLGRLRILVHPVVAYRQPVAGSAGLAVRGVLCEKVLVVLGRQLQQPALKQSVGGHELLDGCISLLLRMSRRYDCRRQNKNHR
jgi:hypothetical protein